MDMVNRIFLFLGIAVMLGSCSLPNGPDWQRPSGSNVDANSAINYDLQAYIPVPVTGASPAQAVNRRDLHVKADWSVTSDKGSTYVPFVGDKFVKDAVYRAAITLEGRVFDPGETFGYSNAAVANQFEAPATAGRTIRTVVVTYNKTESPRNIGSPIDLKTALSAPVWETVPETFFGGETYRGQVEWKTAAGGALAGAFRQGERYTARVSLYPAPGYVFFESGEVVYDGLAVDPRTYTRAGDGTVTVEIAFGGAGTAVVRAVDLTSRVRAPIGGNTPITAFTAPQYEGTVTWKNSKTGVPLTGGERFQGGTEYTATVTLKAVGGYFFPENIALTHRGSRNIAGGAAGLPWSIDFPAAAAAEVSDLDLTNKVRAPIKGDTPMAAFTALQYWGMVEWTETNTGAALTEGERFLGDTAYTAAVTLHTAAGYGIPADAGFAHKSGDVTAAGEGVWAINFGHAADAADDDFSLTYRVPAPETGEKPVVTIETKSYWGLVAWKDSDTGQNLAGDERFRGGAAYTATVTLYAMPGDFPNGEVTVTHNGILDGPTAAFRGTAATVTGDLRFPATGGSSARYSGPFSGTAGKPVIDSVIDRIREAKGENEKELLLNPIPAREEVVLDTAGGKDIGGGLVLNIGDSPKRVIIDGGGRTIDMKGGFSNTGPLITVGSGVTLVLKNITLKGLMKGGDDGDEADNNDALIKVTGGMLELGAGAVICGNGGGGVRVENGGSLTLNGGEIRGNTAPSGVGGGGVYAVAGGTFTMNSGEIRENTAPSGGGGVYAVAGGTFTMNGGEIRGNTALGGGGVYVASTSGSGTFTMNGGEIRGNTALGDGDGGGVYVVSTSDGTFTMSGGYVYGNTAADGGGIYVNGGTFSMNGRGGYINDNTAGRGGGVYVSGTGFFTLDTGYINGNKAGTAGGGVYMDGYEEFRMSGGSISGNEAGNGGGVYAAGGTSRLSGVGVIGGNRAAVFGGGVYITGSAVFEKSGGSIIYGQGAGDGIANTAGAGGAAYYERSDTEHYDRSDTAGAGQELKASPADGWSANGWTAK
jgi:hypothetical protein